MTKVAVRIVKRGSKYMVLGRMTQIECNSFDEAWRESVPYFAGQKR